MSLRSRFQKALLKGTIRKFSIESVASSPPPPPPPPPPVTYDVLVIANESGGVELVLEFDHVLSANTTVADWQGIRVNGSLFASSVALGGGLGDDFVYLDFPSDLGAHPAVEI